MLSGTHRSRSFSPNPELLPFSGTVSPKHRKHVSRKHLGVIFPEPARPGQDPSSHRRAWEREEAPQYRQQVPGGGQAPGWRRGVITQCSR